MINSSGKDQLKCSFCGQEMELWSIWHRRYGYTERRIERSCSKRDWPGSPVQASIAWVQWPLFSHRDLDDRKYGFGWQINGGGQIRVSDS